MVHNVREEALGVQEKLPCASGIYQIRCIPTDKIYIGSTVNLRSRWGRHQRSLRQGKHANSHLQNAWDRYGEAAFEFSVLEYVDKAALLDAEQKWLDESRRTDKSIGFNLSTIAGSPGETQVQVWEGFIDPEGNEVTITNLFDFCRQNNLDWPSTHRLANGKSKLKSYKGWTHKNSIRQRAYIKTYEGFIAPDGSSQGSIAHLAAFCRERGPDEHHMVDRDAWQNIWPSRLGLCESAEGISAARRPTSGFIASERPTSGY